MRALHHLADALHPPSVRGRDWKQRAHLYVLRLGAVLCAVFIPAFGVLHQAAAPAGYDPLWLRAALAAGSLGVFLWSLRSAWVRRHVEALLVLSACVMTGWSAAVCYANGFAADYAVGLFCVFVTSAMLLSLGFERPGPLLAYLGLALALALGLLGAVRDPAVDEALYAASLLLAAALVYVAVSARAQMQAALGEREAQLAEAQRTAGLGNWEWEPVSNRVAWSPELFRLVGLDPERDAPSVEALTARVYRDDRPALARFWTDLLAGRCPPDLTVRLVRPGEDLRAVRVRGEREGGGLGRRPRLFGVLLDVTPEIERAAALVAAKEQAERALAQAEAARCEAEAARLEAETARAQAETARTQAEEAQAHAEEMARLKSAFLANMSHEIRTPLTAIIGFAQVLAEEVPDDQRPLVAPIEQGGRRLLDTLNSVLDLARLQAGRYELSAEPVDAAEEAHALGALLRPMAERKGLALRVAAPPHGLPALADRSALQRVLTNLLSNAVKFTEAGAVTLSAEAVPPEAAAAGPASGWVRLRVRDTGRGIGSAFLPKLFEEFRQESTGLARSHEGSGLGLAITRQLVELMGGTIGVESEAGAGSVFTVTLPAAPPAADAAGAAGAAAAAFDAVPGGDGSPSAVPA